MSTLTFTNDMARLADAMSHCHDWIVPPQCGLGGAQFAHG
jgi:hypothetical protein